MKKATIISLTVIIEAVLIILAAGLLQSYYDSRCLDTKNAGAIVTVRGVYCWRRINESFDNFESLSSLEEKMRLQEEFRLCVEQAPDEKAARKCDPNYITPTPTFEVDSL